MAQVLSSRIFACRMMQRGGLEGWGLGPLGLAEAIALYSANTKKGTAGSGRQKQKSRRFATNVTTIYEIIRQLATFYDNFRLIVPLTYHTSQKSVSQVFFPGAPN